MRREKVESVVKDRLEVLRRGKMRREKGESAVKDRLKVLRKILDDLFA